MTEEVSKEQIKGENGTGIDEAKRLKEKKGANMVVKILAIVLVPLIVIAVIAILALNSAGDRISDAMMKHELAATEYALEMSLNNSAPGDFSYENGALYKGELNLTDNKQVLDALKQNAGVDVALFWGSDLAVTNLTGGTITLSEKWLPRYWVEKAIFQFPEAGGYRMLCISGTFEEYRRHGCGYSGCLYAGKGSECALQRDCNRKSNSDSDPCGSILCLHLYCSRHDLQSTTGCSR